MVAYTTYPWDPRVRREAEALAQRGYAISVVCCREDGKPDQETLDGVAVERLPLTIRRGGVGRYLYQYGLFFILSALAIRRRHPEAVHVHSVPDFIAFAALGPRLRGIPLTLDLHEAMPELILARFPKSRIVVRLCLAAERLSCALANRIIVVNETIRDLVAARSTSADRIAVVYNSPAALGIAPPPTPEPSFDILRLVYAGTVDRERDLETLVRAVAELRPVLPTSLVIYGRGSATYRAYLEGVVCGLGLRDSVRFGGILPADRVLAHLAGSDLGVVTYVRNPLTEVALPNKVFEYVVLDKPLVLPNLRAMRHAFEGGALFYEPGNPKDLAAKIREAAASRAESAIRRERARRVYRDARWEAQAERLAALYLGTARTSALRGWAAST